MKMKNALIRTSLLPFVLLALGLYACLPGCGQLKDEARATAKTVIDCTTAIAKTAIGEYGPTVEQLFVDSLSGDGHVDFDRVKSVTRTYASDAAKCVLASTVARLLNPAAPAAGSPQSSPLAVDHDALAKGWEELRATQLGGVKFTLDSGPL